MEVLSENLQSFSKGPKYLINLVPKMLTNHQNKKQQYTRPQLSKRVSQDLFFPYIGSI